ncbi:MAG TPA: outer membrane protein transport protein [Acetobacteraceae bacterium]|jgi:long-chain fatty acid transport protein|nr:outer membrane protein transport protein [Acetobacteraceae bacterium]
MQLIIQLQRTASQRTNAMPMIPHKAAGASDDSAKSERPIGKGLNLFAAGQAILVIAVAAFFGSAAWAGSGFVLRSQSASTLGSAQAGMTAGADDISTFVFNPAELAYGSGVQFIAGSTLVFSTGHFEPKSATTVLGTSISGGNGGNSGSQVLLPNVFGAIDLPGGFRLGLAATSTYGLGSYWSDGWIGRYYALNSQLLTTDVMPVISYRPISAVSVAAGLDIQYAEAKTTSAVDFGTIDQVLFGGLNGGQPGGSDGLVRNDAKSWAVGYMLGVLAEPIDGTRIGLSFHSQIRQSLTGKSNFETGGAVGASIAAISGAFVSTGVRSDLALPATVTLGVRQELPGRWVLVGDIEWIGWHTLSSLTSSFDNPLQPISTVPLNWHDSWFGAVGAEYQISDRILLRSGIAYDQTPTSDANRVPAIPNLNSIWVSIGLRYDITDRIAMDFAYGHIFSKQGQINQSVANANNTFRGNLQGTISGTVDYVATQIGFRF